MKRKITLFATVIAFVGLAGYSSTSAFAQSNTAAVAVPPAAPAAAMVHHEKHPAIHAAIHSLEQAKMELKAAAHDFGGHREAALKECDAAIAQLKLALQYDK